MRERADEVVDAVEGFVEILDRVRVGEANVAVSVFAKSGARQGGYAEIVQKAVRYFAGWQSQLAKIRKHIECALRHETLDPGNPPQTFEEMIPAPQELDSHGVQGAVVRDGRRGRRGLRYRS